jgi:hypothetical protein
MGNPAASTYESGGPTDNVIPVWKAAAPEIDLLAPDIYMPASEKTLKAIDLYTRPDNALFVPEIGSGEEYVRYLYPVLAAGGIGFSPFGIDDNGRGENKDETSARLNALAQEYAMINPMMREMAKWSFEGRITSVVEKEDHAEQTIDLGSWQAIVTFGASRRNTVQANARPVSKAMIVKLDENEFLLMGSLCHITFKPVNDHEGKVWQYLKVEEGRYENGKFRLLRILNGDETDWGGPRIGAAPLLLHITLITR